MDIVMLIIIIIIIILIIIFLLLNPKSPKFVAAIVEPRKHKDLEYVMQQFRKKLSNNIKIVLFYGKGRINFINSIVKNLKNVVLVELDKKNFTLHDYNNFLKSDEFWKHINGEKVLIFQTDSMLCDNSIYKLDDFYKYDFIGSRTPWDNRIKGGNGGLSLRDVKKSKICIKEFKKGTFDDIKNFGEDRFFPACMTELFDTKMPFPSEKDRFSTQNYFVNKSFGAHQISIRLNDEDKKRFYKYCPEYKTTMK